MHAEDRLGTVLFYRSSTKLTAVFVPHSFDFEVENNNSGPERAFWTRPGLPPLWAVLILFWAGLTAVSQAADYTVTITRLHISPNCQMYTICQRKPGAYAMERH
jgi:hypothetical protein